MCAANNGKMRELPWAERRPARDVRKLGLKSTRGMRRKDLGDADW